MGKYQTRNCRQTFILVNPQWMNCMTSLQFITSETLKKIIACYCTYLNKNKQKNQNVTTETLKFKFLNYSRNFYAFLF